MALTPRQRAFLRTLVRLCQQADGPVHYADVAEAMGVSGFSAYDMLRLLEGKGAVVSQYHLIPEERGPGRPRVLFQPGSRAEQLLARRSLPGQRLGDWKRLQAQILAQLEDLREREYGDYARRLLVRLPHRRSPLLYCTETLAAFLATLADLRARAAHSRPLDALSALAGSGGEVLGVAAGLSLGSLLGRPDCDQELVERLQHCLERYQNYLSRLNDEARASLAEFFCQAIRTVATNL